jgi:hypothetical protein
MVWRRRKVEEEDWKSLRAVERWTGSDLKRERVDAMMGYWFDVISWKVVSSVGMIDDVPDL